MAKAEVTCTCKTCGKTFHKIKYCVNRAEADRYEAWAAVNCVECPDCFNLRMGAQDDEYCRKLQLPEIVGVSEKQVNFAKSLRRRHLLYYKGSEAGPETVKKVNRFFASDRFKEIADARFGGDLEKTKQDFFRAKKSVHELYVAMTETDARKIIDVLKEY